MYTPRLDKCLLNFAFAFFIINIIALSWWGANSRVEYVLPTFCLSFLSILPLCFLKEQRFYNNFERIVFFSGTWLIIFALIGYFNPSCEALKYVDYSYVKPIEHINFLPTSVKAPILHGNALSSIMKIATTLFAVIVAMKLFRRKNYLHWAMNLLAINGTLVAIFGLYQQEMGYPCLYNYLLSDSEFYATFFLSSAAGAFINLSLALNLALLYYNAKAKNFLICPIFLVFSLICTYSSARSGSDGAEIIAYLTIASSIIITIFALLTKVMRKPYAFLFSAFYLSAVALLFLSTTKISYIDGIENRFFEGRGSIYATSINVLKKNPVFGCGGESTRYVLPAQSNIEVEAQGKVSDSAAFRAHMDILEYFLEFGILGAWVIVLSFIAYIFKFFQKLKYLGAENAILFLGVMLCITHSMWDLVLHFQAIMAYMGVIAILSISSMRRYREI